MLNLLDDIIEGNSNEGTIPLLEELANVVKIGSLCGLGKTAPNPILSTLKYFRKEYEDHVYNHHCSTGNCKAFLSYKIVAEDCKSCGICLKKCPVDAITGSKGLPYEINALNCIQCGACLEACKFNAVVLA